ncbi:MAG: (d)CMP kinase [Alphaproteobacteria bacterium]|nr:(d)CMP kinase [Alphaproteobacteria bacterium]
MPSVIIAVDGPAASGKGTVASALARHYDFAYLDTGLLYRAVGWLAQQAGVGAENAAQVAALLTPEAMEQMPQLLDQPQLRHHAISAMASQVAAHPPIRLALLDYQKNFCANPPQGKAGAVLDGRDIGTIIAPHAQVKLFITASPKVRAARRMKQLQAMGEDVSEAAVLADILARDERDRTRPSAPLLQAPDARVIDTTALTAQETIDQALKVVSAITF